MKHIFLPSGSYLLVETPDYEYEIILDLQPKEDWYKIDFHMKFPPKGDYDIVGYTLPSGNWDLIGKGDALKEQDWEAIVSANVNIHNTWFRDYAHTRGSKKPDTIFQFTTATKSGLSLLTHHGYKPETTVLIKFVNK